MLAYARGEAAAFDILYARHKGGVYRYLLRHCGNTGIADELFQDIWMNVIRARAAYAPTARFATWLYTLAHHRIVDHWRAHGTAALVSVDRMRVRNARSPQCRVRAPTNRTRARATANCRRDCRRR